MDAEEALNLIHDAAFKWEQRAQEEYEPEPDYDDHRSSKEGDYPDIEALFSDL